MCKLLANNIVNYQPSRKYHQADGVEPLELPGLLSEGRVAQLHSPNSWIIRNSSDSPIRTFVEWRGKVTNSDCAAIKLLLKASIHSETKRKLNLKNLCFGNDCKQDQLHPNWWLSTFPVVLICQSLVWSASEKPTNEWIPIRFKTPREDSSGLSQECWSYNFQDGPQVNVPGGLSASHRTSLSLREQEGLQDCTETNVSTNVSNVTGVASGQRPTARGFITIQNFGPARKDLICQTPSELSSCAHFYSILMCVWLRHLFPVTI